MATEQQALPPIRLIPVQPAPDANAVITNLRLEPIQEFLQASNFALGIEKGQWSRPVDTELSKVGDRCILRFRSTGLDHHQPID